MYAVVPHPGFCPQDHSLTPVCHSVMNFLWFFFNNFRRKGSMQCVRGSDPALTASVKVRR